MFDVVALLPMVNCFEKSLLTAPDLLLLEDVEAPENDFEWTFFEDAEVDAEDPDAEDKLKIEEGFVEEEVSERFFVSFKESSFGG